jgi:hypothetical protein
MSFEKSALEHNSRNLKSVHPPSARKDLRKASLMSGTSVEKIQKALRTF